MAEIRSEPPLESSQSRLMTKGFVLLCAATALAYAHFGLLTPILPLFIQEHGGTASLVGLVTAAFSVTSFLLRPFIGRAVDHWSARGVMVLGTLVLGLSSLGYSFYHPFLLFVIRATHGTGWAAYNTASRVLVSTNAPIERRGDAAGYFSMAQNTAAALGPVIALWFLTLSNFIDVFVISATGGFLATIATLAIPAWPKRDRHHSKERFWDGLIERSVLVPSILEFLTEITRPTVIIFIPLYALDRGISTESLPYYYLGYGLVGMGARAVLGRLSDRIGRLSTIAFGATTSIIALIITVQARDIVLLTLGGTLYGLAEAAFGPSLMALAIDSAFPGRVGTAMATFSMAFQLAQGLGGFLGGVLIDSSGYRAMYLIMILPPLTAQLILAKNRRAFNVKTVSKPTS